MHSFINGLMVVMPCSGKGDRMSRALHHRLSDIPTYVLNDAREGDEYRYRYS